MRKNYPCIMLALVLAFVYLLSVQTTSYSASITDGFPGHPGNWDALTTNTIIAITLDSPVAMVGDPPVPDMEYCVKKCTFNGLDFVLTDVSCAVEVSDDRKTIRLYPNDLLGESSLYAYKIIDINFQGGGSQQDFSKYFETGDNPITSVLTHWEDETTIANDEGGNLDLTFQCWCIRCHTDHEPYESSCPPGYECIKCHEWPDYP